MRFEREREERRTLPLGLEKNRGTREVVAASATSGAAFGCSSGSGLDVGDNTVGHRGGRRKELWWELGFAFEYENMEELGAFLASIEGWRKTRVVGLLEIKEEELVAVALSGEMVVVVTGFTRQQEGEKEDEEGVKESTLRGLGGCFFVYLKDSKEVERKK